MDEVEDIPVSTKIQHVVPSVLRKSKRIPQRPSSDNALTTRTTFAVKEIFDLPIEVTLGEFLDRSGCYYQGASLQNMQKHIRYLTEDLERK